MLAGLKSHQSHAGFKICRFLRLPDHSRFLFLARLVAVKPRSENPWVRTSKNIEYIVVINMYTGGPFTTFQVERLIFSLGTGASRRVSELRSSTFPPEPEGFIEFRNVPSQDAKIGSETECY